MGSNGGSIKLKSTRRRKFRFEVGYKTKLVIGLSIIAIIIGVTSTKTKVNKVDIVFENLPMQFSGYKIAVISDINNNKVGNLVEEIDKNEPDLVVYTGGYADEAGNYNVTTDVLNKISSKHFILHTSNQKDKEIYGNIQDKIPGGDSAEGVMLELNEKNKDFKEYLNNNLSEKHMAEYNGGNKDTYDEINILSDRFDKDSKRTVEIMGIKNSKNIKNDVYDTFSNNELNTKIVITGDTESLNDIRKTNADIIISGMTDKDIGNGIIAKDSTITILNKGIENGKNLDIVTLRTYLAEDKNPLEKFLGKITGE